MQAIITPSKFAKFSNRISVASALLALGSFGCGADIGDPSEGPIESATSALTACDAASIAAAIRAGGDVALDCGPAPITIELPSTITVTVGTRVHAIRPGTITFTHFVTLFSLATPISFEVDDIKFDGRGTNGMAIHSVTGSVVLRGTSFQNYRGLLVSVHNGSNLSVTNSTFTGNSLTGFAGPIYSEGSTTTVTGSTFTGNSSTGTGGAIVQLGGRLTVNASTFLGNSANTGGAIAFTGFGTHSVTNSTFVSNRGSNGAAISAPSGVSLTVRNCTFSENPGTRGSILAGTTVQAFNVILVDSTSPSTATCSVGGSSNLEWPLARCAGFRLANPRLAGLANNGGPTATMALSPGSPAIDTATVTCPTVDQRGVTRPRDGDGNGSRICDLGAYER